MHVLARGSREVTREEVENARGSSLKPAAGNREHGRKDKEHASSGRPQLKFLVYGLRNAKDRRVIIGILPCVEITSLETDAFMTSVACIDILTVRRKPTSFREKYSRNSCHSERE